MDKRQIVIIAIILNLVFSVNLFGQKRLRTKQQLAAAHVYRSLDEALAYRKGVYILNLDGNNLYELPSKIGKLTNLQELYLRNNNLSLLPPETWQLTNLQKLMLGENNFAVIPN